VLFCATPRRTRTGAFANHSKDDHANFDLPARAGLCATLPGNPGAHADPLSYARYDQVRTRDLQLDLKADFKQKTLSGYAELS